MPGGQDRCPWILCVQKPKFLSKFSSLLHFLLWFHISVNFWISDIYFAYESDFQIVEHGNYIFTHLSYWLCDHYQVKMTNIHKNWIVHNKDVVRTVIGSDCHWPSVNVLSCRNRAELIILHSGNILKARQMRPEDACIFCTDKLSTASRHWSPAMVLNRSAFRPRCCCSLSSVVITLLPL